MGAGEGRKGGGGGNRTFWKPSRHCAVTTRDPEGTKPVECRPVLETRPEKRQAVCADRGEAQTAWVQCPAEKRRGRALPKEAMARRGRIT